MTSDTRASLRVHWIYLVTIAILWSADDVLTSWKQIQRRLIDDWDNCY